MNEIPKLPQLKLIEIFVNQIENQRQRSSTGLVYEKIYFFQKLLTKKKTKKQIAIIQNSLKKCLRVLNHSSGKNKIVDEMITYINFKKFPNREILQSFKDQHKSYISSYQKNQEIEAENNLCKQLKQLSVENDLAISQNSVDTKEKIKMRIFDFFRNKTKIVFENDSIESQTNWVYLYSFPYDFDETQKMEEINEIISPFGEIEEFKALKMIDFQQFSIVEDFELKEGTSKNFTQFLKENFKAETISRGYESLLPKFNNKLKQNKKTLFNIVMEQKQLKFKRSVVLIKLSNYESKKKLLNPDFEVFGICHNSNMVKVADADHKKTIEIKNHPTNMTAKELLDVLNVELKKNGLETFELGKVNPHKNLEHKPIYLTFSNFETALKALSVIREISFSFSKLGAMFTHGGLVYNDGELQDFEAQLTKEFLSDLINQSIFESNYMAELINNIDDKEKNKSRKNLKTPSFVLFN